MNRVKTAVALLWLSSALSCTGQESAKSTASLPAGWVETTATANALDCANYSREEWKVETSSGELRFVPDQPRASMPLPPGFRRTKEMRGDVLVQQVPDGCLAGFDAGEFGGGLWWFSGNNGEPAKNLSSENVQAIVKRGNDVLIFTGLSHLGLDRGKVYLYGSESPHLTLVADLGTAPSAAILTPTSDIFVAGARAIINLTPDNRVVAVYRSEEMAFLYPNSIAATSNGDVFVGMRFYVLHLQPTKEGGYATKWMIPARCRKTKQKDYDCICTGKP